MIFGTLAQRSKTSRETLYRVLDTVKASEFFFDVNLRLSFYTKEIIEASLRKATIVKMNDDEIIRVSEMLGADGIRDIMDRYDIKIAITTYGKDGTRIHEKGKDDIIIGAGNVLVKDTVGAGDSLSAAFLYFYTTEKDIKKAGEKAALLADYVVGEKGAIPEYSQRIREKLFS